MKILKIFGIVVGIHVFALILIFANPGCSTSTKTAAKPADTVAQTEPGPAVSLPTNFNLNYGSSAESPVSSAPLGSDTTSPISFNPEASATVSTGVRYSPTRPNTPAASTLQSAPVTDVVPASTYSVTKGDSLWSVAKKNHLTVAELADANNLSAGATLRLGQKLIIPGKAGNANPPSTTAAAAAPTQTETAAPRPTTESVTHVVKAGETLGAIARKYQVSVGEVATANNITDPAKIRPGRELIIPGWKGTSAKSTGTTKSASATTTPTETKPVAPIFTLPPAGQDLDQGIKPTSEAPVIKVEEASPFSPN